ncbi:MAG: putative metal-binding motif-containing protein [Kofleriaceae bacterium]|jgi:hypothetical protein|nr:putative metal-binding motif-containing protein [Kofleriaceae bacterium]MBP6836091.1 putative metal-binding motif-containing protein [Kofleriaceae bacterium]MBP9205187.1 putative metal-binding motif-containing protein [Kofleriaceae bacterium]
MRTFACLVSAALLQAGCSDDPVGVLIVARLPAEIPLATPAGPLEVYVGLPSPRGGTALVAREYLRSYVGGVEGDDEARLLDEAALHDGFNILLTYDPARPGPWAVGVAAVGEGLDAPSVDLFGVVEGVQFAPGQLRRYEVVLMPPGADSTAAGGPSYDQVDLTPLERPDQGEQFTPHACVRWRERGATRPWTGAFVRDGDGDCDGTTPRGGQLACDAAQIDPDVPDDVVTPDADVDADGYVDPDVCQGCAVSARCDCDDGKFEVNPGAYEACEGKDTDCDPMSQSDQLAPCVLPSGPAGTCALGKRLCGAGERFAETCLPLGPNDPSFPCVDLALDAGACSDPESCQIDAPSRALTVGGLACHLSTRGSDLCPALAQLGLSVPPPGDCVVGLWGEVPGVTFELLGPGDQPRGVDRRVLRGPCAQMQLHISGAWPDPQGFFPMITIIQPLDPMLAPQVLLGTLDATESPDLCPMDPGAAVRCTP